ncbi:hypothetical protein BURK1_01388 [Burkholderiales bacterium]|nr:hypothetical protein BURK1_01388 [Burkholderiales bacterium]
MAAGPRAAPGGFAEPSTLPRPILSVILPFYRKLAEFERVLPLNAPWLARDGLEVVVAMDDASDEPGLLELVRRWPSIRWNVVVNDTPHAWRPPCRAINVGLRHAEGTYVFVASPESAFAGDAPGIALDAVKDFPGGVAIGRVAFARFADLADPPDVAQAFDALARRPEAMPVHYGSICGPRAAFERIRGYDESLSGWGADDDNLRIRLELDGATLLACDRMRLLHLSFDERPDARNTVLERDPGLALAKCSPAAAIANREGAWGESFSRVAYAHAQRRRRTDEAPGLTPAPPDVPPPPGSVVPVASLHRCRACGRRLHFDPPRPGCAACGAASRAPGSSQPPAAHVRRRPRVACVMQLRNEAAYLPGCLDHLRGHVDAILALDDGSTDATRSLLARDPAVADTLTNAARADHAWNERENKRRLVERALELGFDWVLCCDADERFEEAFLARLRAIAASFRHNDVACVWLVLKELWDSPRHFRQDGIWGRKTRARFFRVPPRVRYDLDRDLHGQWYPDHVRKYGRKVPSGFRLYHLKTIRREDRIRRREFHNALDPQRRFQPSGYDYLAEEPDDLLIVAIEPGREYDFATLPDALRG